MKPFNSSNDALNYIAALPATNGASMTHVLVSVLFYTSQGVLRTITRGQGSTVWGFVKLP